MIKRMMIIVRIELASDQTMPRIVERIIPIDIFFEAAKFENRLESRVRTAKPTTGEKSIFPKRRNFILVNMFKKGSQIFPRIRAALL